MTNIAMGRAAPPLVLLGNDQEWSARSLESILGPRGFATVRAYTGRQLLELARNSRPDAVVLDRSLPDMSGIDVVYRLRTEAGLSPATPIVVLTTGTPSRTERHDASEAGVWELLSEPVDVEGLALKLHVFIRAKREGDSVADAGLVDAETGFYNARGISRRSREVASEAARRGHPVSCIALSAVPRIELPSAEAKGASRALQRLIHLCRTRLRAADVLGRLGPQDVIVIAPAADAHGSRGIITRLAAALREGDVTGSELELRVGVASVEDYTASAADVSTLIVQAFTELRRAPSHTPGRPLATAS